MRSILARLAFLAAMIPASALAQSGDDVPRVTIPGTDQKVGHWDMYAWKQGSRAGCTMSVNYRSGVEMSFSLEGDQWRIGWWHRNWRYADNQWIQVTYWVDRSPPQTMNAERTGGTKEPWLRAVLPDSSDLFEQFRLGNQLHIRLPGGANYTFNLTGTSVALAALRSCAARHRGTEASPVTTGAGAGRDGPVIYALPTLTADQRVDVVRLAANLLTKLPGFRLLNEEEQRTLNKQLAGLQAAVVWSSESVHGLIHLFPDEKEENIAKLAGTIIGGSAQFCKERFTAMTEPDVRSPSVRRIHSNCTEGAAGVNVRVILMPAGKSGIYFFVTEGTPKDDAIVQRADELLRNALFEVVKK